MISKQVERLLSALNSKGLQVTGSGTNFAAQCPSHDDRHASLCIGEGADGNALVFCQAGCETVDVVKALGLTLADLFPPSSNGSANGPNGTVDTNVVERAYRICDYDGNEIALHHRRDTFTGGKRTGKDMWWSRSGKKGLDGMKVRDLPLYGTELLKTNPDSAVVITEGEKAADALRRRGIFALATVTGAGGKTAKCPSVTVLQCLAGREVALWPDDDDIGRQHMMLVAHHLRGVAKSVATVNWKGPTAKCDAADFTGTDDELRAILGSSAPVDSRDTPAGGIITVSNDIKKMTDDGIAAILQAMPGQLYQRYGELSVVRPAEPSDSPGSKPPTIAPILPPRLRELYSCSAMWQQINAVGQARECMPPMVAVETALARPDWPGVPVLAAISEIPILRRDGSIAQDPGYDESSHVLFEPPPGVAFDKVPTNPSTEQIQASFAALCEPLTDFPFVNDSARAAAVAAILTIVGRHAVDGPVPMFHFGAPTRGTGKTMLASACVAAATGRAPAVFIPSKDEIEQQKSITAIGRAGIPVVLLDNIEGSFGSAAMAAAVTNPNGYQGRILGRSEIVSVALRTVWLTTGNNTTWVGDLGRRVIPIDQDPLTECPENRGGFKHPDLIHYVKTVHPSLAVAALTILRSHAVAGRPDLVDSHLGSFESWDRVIRSAVIWASGLDPCEGRKKLAETSDEDHQDLGQVLVAWHAAWSLLGRGAVTSAEAVARAVGAMHQAKTGIPMSQIDSDFVAALRTICPTGDLDAKRISYWLRSKTGRIVGGLKFASEAKRNMVAWRVERV